MYNSVLNNATYYTLDHYNHIINEIKIEHDQMSIEKDNQVKKESKKIKKAPVQSSRTTRGVKLGNLSENAMVKKSYDQLQSKDQEKTKV